MYIPGVDTQVFICYYDFHSGVEERYLGRLALGVLIGND